MAGQDTFDYEIEQITFGPKNHFFGYIGHAGTIAWNATNRYILSLRTTFQDHMPGPGETADIVLIDTENGYAIEPIDQTCGWNPQQGTMFFWNPTSAETQFFFNDRDPNSGKIFTVLFDIEQKKRIREYHYDNVSFGNSGVAQKGTWFLGINYARLARLRLVTGYKGSLDWTENVAHPEDDGIFRVHIDSGEKELIVTFSSLREALINGGKSKVGALFINHTLWNRNDEKIYFYVRSGYDGSLAKLPKPLRDALKVNTPFTVNPDGSNLTEQKYLGGHPEWEKGTHLLACKDGKLIIYDTDKKEIIDQVADPTIIEDPTGDSALSPDGNWVVTGYGKNGHNIWVVYSRLDGRWIRTPSYDQRPYIGGGSISSELRSDPAPLWNRDGTKVLFPSLTPDGSRQLHIIHLKIK